MLINLPLLSLSMSGILGIDVTIVIYPILHINFSKIPTNSEVVLLITLLFDRMLNLVRDFTKCYKLHNFTTLLMGN